MTAFNPYAVNPYTGVHEIDHLGFFWSIRVDLARLDSSIHVTASELQARSNAGGAVGYRRSPPRRAGVFLPSRGINRARIYA
jgi:hypothetical protein